jgi:glycerol-3-phosphate acyltransferase PlsY
VASDLTVFSLAALFGYLAGSVPFGILLTRLAGTADLRTIGSGNIGATNVLRTGRRDLAALTLLLDLVKGSFAVVVGTALYSPEAGLVAGLGAFLGHLFPLWLGFRGGKGVATFLGVLLAVEWRAALVFGLVWLAVAALLRYSSLAALVATLAASVFLLLFSAPAVFAAAMVMAVLLWLKHLQNIRRLLAGTESRIGAK